MEEDSESDVMEAKDSDEEGLSSRYKQALDETNPSSKDEDYSFTRYLRASQMND